ncbi:putative rhamnosyl transferase [Aestuariivita boseongensis]|uniref:putative rhamnosyl transferase n=1 Tax=Aestuariivita boseongensis TaxID=1470562 RepID=UPI000680B4D2|nr:putative rhamnosyl transferase [Aestuariivita boseongensis]
MQVIGLCRFSYPGEGGFQVEHGSIEERIAYLYAPERMEARLAQFEAITLPGLKAQTDPDFTFVIVIGDSLPDIWRARLETLIADFPQAQLQAHPPGPHRKVMQGAINAARLDMAAPCLQFRHDDDDAVAVDFVERLRAAAREHAQLLEKNRLVAIDFEKGFSARPGPDGIDAMETRLSLYGVALGMAVRGGAKQTIMNFAHKKLGKFMPVIRYDDSPMFVRGHNDHNDSRQKAGVPPLPLSPLDAETQQLFEDRFAIRQATVRRVFAAF